MVKKLNQEEVNRIYNKKGYEVISEYKNSDTIIYVKNKDGYICISRYRTFKNNSEPLKFHKSNPYTIQNIKLWMKTNAKGYELLSKEYKGATNKLLFKCPNGHKFEMSWNDFKNKNRCPYCSNKQIELGINTIWDTDRWMCDLGVSEEDAKIYSHSSGKKITVTCPHCGNKKKIRIADLYIKKSISCICNDGISYPEKFIISLLNQLEIEYQHDNYWIENKRYDFYLPNYNIIIECHGEQHYRDKTGLKTTLKEQIENDEYKKQLALNNNINEYIVIDCRYSELDWIKDNILKSKLSKIFNLSNINWIQCEEFALSNKVKEICDYWRFHNEINKEDLSIIDISKIFNLGRATIYKYLKQGTKLDWCNYNLK